MSRLEPLVLSSADECKRCCPSSKFPAELARHNASCEVKMRTGSRYPESFSAAP